MYATHPDGSSAAFELASVGIPEKNNRLEQRIRNDLIASMSPVGQDAGDKYRFDFEARQSEFDISIEKDSDVNRRSYQLQVSYALTDLATGARLLDGSTFSHVPYDRVNSEFANIQARINASERAAAEVAENMRTRLAAYFATQ